MHCCACRYQAELTICAWLTYLSWTSRKERKERCMPLGAIAGAWTSSSYSICTTDWYRDQEYQLDCGFCTVAIWWLISASCKARSLCTCLVEWPALTNVPCNGQQFHYVDQVICYSRTIQLTLALDYSSFKRFEFDFAGSVCIFSTDCLISWLASGSFETLRSKTYAQANQLSIFKDDINKRSCQSFNTRQCLNLLWQDADLRACITFCTFCAFGQCSNALRQCCDRHCRCKTSVDLFRVIWLLQTICHCIPDVL